MQDSSIRLEQLKIALEQAPCGIGLFDVADEKPIFLNKMYYDYVGYTPEEYERSRGENRLADLFPADMPVKTKSAAQFKKDGKAAGYEYRMIRKDGSKLWLKMSATTITVDCGPIAFVSFTDITKEKELERKTAHEQARLQMIADEMNAAVFEWIADGKQFYASDSFQNYAISKVAVEDILQNRGPMDLVHPDDSAVLGEFFKETKSEKNRAEATLRMKMSDGTYRWCKLIGIFFRDQDGKNRRIVGIVLDVNEEHERSFMLDSMINDMPCGVGVFTFAPKLLCEYYSDGFPKMAGITRAEMDKKLADNTVFTSLIAPMDLEEVVSTLMERTARGLPLNMTYRYVYNDGNLRWLHLSGAKLREDDGYPVYYCIFTNPTEETAQYGDVVENSPSGVFVAEKATRKTMFVNEAAASMFGFPGKYSATNRSVVDALKSKGKAPLLTRDQVDALTPDKFTEFRTRQDGKYFTIRAKEIIWNGVVSYILYIMDETNAQTLVSSIPGGVAVYRVKKDGYVTTDYVSDGLAALCGYAADEFLRVLKDDAMSNLVPEDIPAVAEKLRAAIAGDGTLSASYRVYTKERNELLIRLDANKMPETQLEEDDLAAFYAVHTAVSEESKQIMEGQKYLHELIDQVPAGICIYEIRSGVIQQSYMNDFFYSMLGSARASRQKYTGVNSLKAAHPDDIAKINDAIGLLAKGQSITSVPYRLVTDDGGWHWVNMTGAVVERRENYLKIYAVCSDYSAIMKAQDDSNHVRKMLEVALQSAGVLAWRYDYKHKRITDSGTLGEVYHLPRVVENVPQSIIDREFVAEESREQFYQMFREVAEEKPAHMDTKAVSPDGKGVTWYRQAYTPVFDENGNYLDAVGIAMDITEQKKKEQLYEEQLRLNRIAAADALTTVSMNLTQNTITSFSSNVPEMDALGRFKTADELLGSINSQLTETQDIKKFDCVADSGRMLAAFESGNAHIEIEFRFFHNTKWLRVTYDMLCNPYTGDVEAVSSVYDITGKVRAEKVISQLTELDYQSLMLIDVATGKATPYQTGHHDDNMAMLMQFQNEENNSQTGLAEFMHKMAVPGTAEKAIQENSMACVIKQLEKAPSYSCMQSLVIGGKVQHFRVLYTYLQDDHSLILSAVQNVTETYEKEVQQNRKLTLALKAAEAASEAKTAFLSRVSHDMRTPLNGILGLTSLMKDMAENPKVADDLRQLELSGKYLLNLINDTLDVSRIESGKIDLHPAVCDSRKAISNILNLSQPGIAAKNIHLIVNADKLPMSPVYFDEGRLQQIAMNILSNAVKFTPDGGTIEITGNCLSVENGVITNEFIIKDNGIGMSKEFIPHVFEAFSQEDASTKSNKEGTGLGMAITHRLVKRMGGEMSVESEKGKGTSVRVVLPFPIATKAQIAEWKNAKKPHVTSYHLNGKRILLCEDHPLNAQIAVRVLKKVGVEVEHVENGAMGVEKFSASCPGYYDAILMDLRMPVMDGLEAARTIRALNREDAGTIPILAMTANALAEDVRSTRAAGMDAHLSKPIDPLNLYQTLDHAINPQKINARYRVLVVDDIELNRALIKKALAPEYDVYEANGAAEALDMLEQHHGMDAVITDVQMPDMDGFKLIKEIRSKEEYRHMAIIANTQYDAQGQEARLLELGASDFIYKPANPKIIKMRVRNALDKA